MSVCPYCGAENANDEIFCEECGRPLKKSEKKKKVSQKYRKTIEGGYSYTATSQIIVDNNCNGSLMFPDTQSYKDGKWELSFRPMIGCNLAEYIADEKKQKVMELVIIEHRLLELFEEIQNNRKIVGSCDLEDFFVPNYDLDNLVLRVVRPMLNKNELPEEYVAGEFSAPEIKNKNRELIENRTDVYLAAIIFNRMIIKSKYTAGNIDAQLFWGYTLTNGAFCDECKALRRFHQWLGECLNMYPQKRKRNIKDCRLGFEKSCDLEVSKINSDITLEDVLETNVGKGKKAMMESVGREKNEWNEDSIEKWEKEICGEKVRAYLLADGISNCDVGSGYYASNSIRDNFKAVLDEYVDDRFDDVTYDMVEELAYEIVRRSNNDIWDKACEYEDQSGSIMGSTFVFIFIIAGGMYTYCLGDSPLYLIRRGNIIPLYSPDSAGFMELKKGMSYDDYRQMEGKDSIAFYVGGEYARTSSEYYKMRHVDVMTLQENDIILAASDGVLDYMGAKLSDTAWDKELAIVKMLLKREPLNMIASHVIKKDNVNGGGDNLSMILIKAGGVDNE